MWIMTFHAACLRILRRHADILGYTNSFIVYDPVDTKAVVKKILKDRAIDEKKFPVGSLLGAISHAGRIRTQDIRRREIGRNNPAGAR